jgi:hypothetical protein
LLVVDCFDLLGFQVVVGQFEEAIDQERQPLQALEYVLVLLLS